MRPAKLNRYEHMEKTEKKKSGKGWRFFVSLCRGFAGFLAVYSCLSLAAVVFRGVYNQNVWWIDLHFLSNSVSAVVQALLTIALGVFALRLPRHWLTRILVAIPISAGFVAAVINTIDVYRIAFEGTIVLGFPLPFSFFVSGVLLCILLSNLVGYSLLSKRHSPVWAQPSAVVVAVVFVILLFPLGQITCFGTTDYRGQVDATVVLGARVYPDGTPSPALQDRLDTAIRFYEEGFTPILIVSGGIDDDGINEAEAMRNYAIAHGVDPAHIIIDEHGDTTELTAQNTVAMLQAAGFSRIAAVSNFYHLARIKMLYLAAGMDVVTIPSVDIKSTNYPLFNVIREIPGWWYYWLQNLVE